MDVKLTWTPGSGATNQTVQYRLQGSSTWTTYAVINNNTTSSTIVTIPDGNYNFRVINSCTGCLCPDGSTPDSYGICGQTPTITASTNPTITEITRTPSEAFGPSGTLIHSNLSITGPTTRLDITNPFWIAQLTTSIPNWNSLTPMQQHQAQLENGPVNRLAIWGRQNDSSGVPFNNYTMGNLGPFNTWIGFSVCISLPTTKTYYIGIAADNFYRFSLDGQVVLTDQRGTSESFTYYHIYPLIITAGSHIINVEGFNTGDNAGFACEIYDLDNRGSLSVVDFLNQQTNYTNFNIVFTTRGATQFTSDNFTCPSGYTLLNPSCELPICIGTNSTVCTNQNLSSNTASVQNTCPPPTVGVVTLEESSIAHP